MKSGLPIIVSLLLAGAPALARGADAPNAQPAVVVKAKMVCRTQTQTGSRIAQSVCLGENEWKRIDEQKAAQAKDLMNRADGLAGTQIPQGTANGPGQMGPNGYGTGTNP